MALPKYHKHTVMVACGDRAGLELVCVRLLLVEVLTR
jgi:hypothetical protein